MLWLPGFIYFARQRRFEFARTLRTTRRCRRRHPRGKNPPAGAIIDYSLQSVPAGLVTLEILDSAGKLVRKYSSSDEQRKPDETQSFPTYWFNPPAPLSKKVGLNRFVWDLRYERPRALRYGYSIAAAYGEDAIMVPEGPLALPGIYQVKLTVDGRAHRAPLEVKMDPRVKTPQLALSQQQQLSLKIRIIEGMRTELRRRAADQRLAQSVEGAASQTEF